MQTSVKMVSNRLSDVKLAMAHLKAWRRQGEGINWRKYICREGPNVLTTSLNNNILFLLHVHYM